MENDETVEVLRLGTSSKRLDEVAIAQGVKKDCPFRPGLSVLILPAASYNPRYRKALQNSRRAKGPIKVDEQDPAAAEAAANEAFVNRYEDPEFVVEAFVADIHGLYDGAGQPVPYTRERGIRILSALANADVKQWITDEAHQYGSFYTEDVERDAGN